MTLHADDNAVSLLSIAMTTKLRKMRAKGRSGWDSESCTQQHLSNLLRAAVEKGDTVDVANYCAFLLARVESILPAEQPKPVASGGWMEQLGFEVRQHDDMLRIVVDDCGNEREATLTERVLWDALMTANAEFAEAPQAPATEPVARAIFTNRNKPDVEWLVESVTRGMLLYAAPQAPAAPEDPMDWPLPCDVTVGHGTIRKGCKLRTLVLRMQVLYQLAQETELAAPAAPAVDASPLLAPETELDAVVRDAAQIIRDAEHYRFIKRHRLILSGGTDTFGWPIAPFGDECDRYIAQELATERAAQAKEGGEAA